MDTIEHLLALLLARARSLSSLEVHNLVIQLLLVPTLIILVIVLVVHPAPVDPAPILTVPTMIQETPWEYPMDEFGNDLFYPTAAPYATRTLVPIPLATFTTTPELVDSTWPIRNLYFKSLSYPDMRQSSEWSMSEDGVRYVAFWEGYVGHLYDDGGQVGVGNCTIGYGHLLHLGPCSGGESPSSISQASALELLRAELDNCGNYVDKYVTAPISQQQYNILSGLVCGWGYEPFSKSKVLKALNNCDYVGAAEVLKETAVYGIGIGLCPGLVRRREVESSMFLFSPGMPMWPFDEHNMPDYSNDL